MIFCKSQEFRDKQIARTSEKGSGLYAHIATYTQHKIYDRPSS